jgi:oxygen-independent coproporphyrinogen-3 oxidase
MKNYGVYIHIPFCKQACHYCNFHFSTNLKLKTEMLYAIAKEMQLRKGYIGSATISSIYFGGGTPSLLESGEINLLLEQIKNNFHCNSDIEITLEINPDDASLDKLLALRSIGINRLSIGIQSFNNDVLRYINRAHDTNAATECIKMARSAAFHNISIDLIYAIPTSDSTMWQTDLDIAMTLNPEHISSYCLTIEKSTVFGDWLEKGKLKEVAESSIVKQYHMLIDTLASHGYTHYEVSNFAKPGYQSIHNSNYWNQSYGYMGLGPGAHSYNGITREWNVENNSLYIKSISQNEIPCKVEYLTKEDKINEYIMTSLRTDKGCSNNWLLHNYGYDLINIFYQEINSLIANELCLIENDNLLLTESGMLLADGIAKDFFINCKEVKTYQE